MNIEEAKEAKFSMEKDIHEIIKKFEKSSGICVDFISLVHLEQIDGPPITVLVQSSVRF